MTSTPPSSTPTPDATERHRTMKCPECGRIASVPDRCNRPICVHVWEGYVPEIWDGDDLSGDGRTIEESPNPDYRKPGPDTWTAMVEVTCG